MNIISSILPLATNLATKNRDYVVFVGAGLSKDAGVMSGWDILIETLRPIYITDTQIEEEREITQAEITDWYLNNGKVNILGYSEILEQMFPGNIERREYLKHFFEKVNPGEAHKELAKLVAMGFIRFIFTTNFDDLIEKALDELNVNYDVIFSDDILVETKSWDRVKECRIYKLHGDYKVGKIRNTLKELASLEPMIAQDFQYIIDRHGIIVIGYSGRDHAIMEHFRNRRPFSYPMYWQYLEMPERTDEFIYFHNLKDSYEKEYNRPIEFIQNGSAFSFLRQITGGIEKLNMLLIIDQNKFSELDNLVVNSDSKKIRYLSYEILNNIINKFDEYRLKEEGDRFFRYKFEMFSNLITETIQFIKYLDILLKYDQDNEYVFIVKNFMKYILDLIKTGYGDEFIKHSYPYFILLASGSLLVRYDKLRLSDIFWEMRIIYSNYESIDFMDYISMHGEGWDYIKQEIYKSNYIDPKYSIIRDHLLPEPLLQREIDSFDSYITLKVIMDNLNVRWFNGSTIYDNRSLLEIYKKHFESRINTIDQANELINNIRKKLAYALNRSFNYSIDSLIDSIILKFKTRPGN